jgi:hypothetical protein
MKLTTSTSLGSALCYLPVSSVYGVRDLPDGFGRLIISEQVYTRERADRQEEKKKFRREKSVETQVTGEQGVMLCIVSSLSEGT